MSDNYMTHSEQSNESYEFDAEDDEVQEITLNT